MSEIETVAAPFDSVDGPWWREIAKNWGGLGMCRLRLFEKILTEQRYPLLDGMTPAGSAIAGALQALVDTQEIEHGIIDAIKDRYEDYLPDDWGPEGLVPPTEAPPLALRWGG